MARKQVTLNYKIVVTAETDDEAVQTIRRIMETALYEYLVVQQKEKEAQPVIYKPKVTHIKDVADKSNN